MFWGFLAVLSMFCIIGIFVLKQKHKAKIKRMIVNGKHRGVPDKEIADLVDAEVFVIPNNVTTGLACSVVVFAAISMFNNIFFYAEPGYLYHVRTITGSEKMVDDVGYNMHLFGTASPWKKSMSIISSQVYASAMVQCAAGQTCDQGPTKPDTISGGLETKGQSSSTIGPIRTIFLDQVDAKISATARFMLPADGPSFLAIAQQYRSPDNLVRTTLLPAFRETLQGNADLMGAEDYFAGKRTKFNIEFEEQLKRGLYVVRRTETVVNQPQNLGPASANAAKGTKQDNFGTDAKTVFVVERVLDKDGVPIRKAQSFTALGITVVESRITDVVPNPTFSERMMLKQKASADRAIAREQRIQEQEQKLLEVATGERKVAKKLAEALVVQIERTTDAETQKQLSITKANQQKESAVIDKERAAVLLEIAEINANSVRVTAEAEAYKKQVILEADNALAQKLSALVQMNKDTTAAMAQRAVPQYVIYNGTGESESQMGQNGDVTNTIQTQLLKNLRVLDVSLDVKQ